MKEPIANLALSNAVRPGRRRLAEDARPGARAGRHHRQHDRARPDRHRAAALALRRDGPSGRRSSTRIPAAPASARRPRSPRPSCFLASSAGRLRQRHRRAGRRRPPERALLGDALTRVGLLWGVAAVAVAVARNRLVRPLPRLPLRPEHGDARCLQGDGRGREAACAGPGAHLLRRRLDPARDLGRAAFAFLRPDGATLVPQAEVVPPGLVVRGPARGRPAGDGALGAGGGRGRAQAGGLQGRRRPTEGALVEAVATDVPAAKKLESGDVIVMARGQADVRTPGELRTAFTGVQPGRRRRPSRPARRQGRDRDREDGRVAERAGPRDHRDPRRAGGRHQAAGQGRHRPRPGRRAVGRAAVRARRAPGARHRTSTTATGSSRPARSSSTASVGPIGGVKQKTYGARKAGADVFLVPAGENAAEARRYAGNLRIIPVESFQQALSALRTLPAK